MWAVLRIGDVYPGSGVLIFTHPGSRIPDLGSRIPDPKTVTKERGEKKFVVKTFFYCHKFHKIVNYFIFGSLKKKMCVNFQRIIELFTQKIVKNMGLGSGIRDPGSGKNLFRIPDPGVKKAPDPQHCMWVFLRRLNCTLGSVGVPLSHISIPILFFHPCQQERRILKIDKYFYWPRTVCFIFLYLLI
jgi:hypothetical protein